VQHRQICMPADSLTETLKRTDEKICVFEDGEKSELITTLSAMSLRRERLSVRCSITSRVYNPLRLKIVAARGIASPTNRKTNSCEHDEQKPRTAFNAR